MKIPLFLVLAAGVAALCPGTGAAAQTILNETWESDANGAAPSSPWVVSGGGGTGTPSTVTVANATFNGVTSNWVGLNNTATDEGANNPGLSYSFTPTTSLLNVSFTYTVTQTSGNSTQLEFFLQDASNHNAITLVLGKNYQGGGMGYLAGGTFTSMGDVFVLGETVTVNLTNIDLSTGTFGYSWTSSVASHPSGSGTGAFNASVTSISKISFSDNSPVGGTSQLYLDNISVAAVPEPRPLAFAGALGLGLAAAAAVRRLRAA